MPTEGAIIFAFYAGYEAARGIVAGSRQPALHRAHEIARAEQDIHLFQEPRIQRFIEGLPGLVGVLNLAYLTLHLTVTVAALLWLHRRHPRVFPTVRTTLIVASALSLVGFLAFPTAPPRLAGIGLTDTVTRGAVSLNHGFISSLYNPYAAVPSMHAGYALIVGVATTRYAEHRSLRIVGALYPLFVLLVIVATGNHFFFDAATGMLVAGAGAAVAVPLRASYQPAELIRLPDRRARALGRSAERAA